MGFIQLFYYLVRTSRIINGNCLCFSIVQLFLITGGERKGCFLCEFLICNTVGSKCQLRSGKIEVFISFIAKIRRTDAA